MKKYLLPVTLLMSSFFAHAQSIGYLDLPVAGELWIEFKDTVGANFTIPPSGAGQTWNYLNSFTVHDTIEFQPMLTTSVPANIAALYPQSNLVSETDVPGDYIFIKTTFAGSGGMYIDGMHSDTGFDVSGFTVNDMNYSNDLLYIPIPFQFGDVVQNTATFDYVYPEPTLFPGCMVRVTYSTFQDMETESQGQLTTPLGNYASVIRVKEMITKTVLYEIDSFAVGNYTYLTDMSYPTTTSYKWLKNGPNCVIMTAELDEFNNVKQASYYTSSGLVNDKTGIKNASVNILPNPVNKGNTITLSLTNLNATALTIYDLSGREIYQASINKGSTVIPVPTETFETGLYYLKVVEQNKVQTVTKFVVSN